MTGYRVADEALDDPLAVDEALVRQQHFRERLGVHILVSVMTVGLWLPVLIGWLAMSSARVRRWADGYAARISAGRLSIGNATEMRTVPLDAIADASIAHGRLRLSVRGALPATISGLRDPIAASRAILEARDEHLRALRSDQLEHVLQAEQDVPRGRRRR